MHEREEVNTKIVLDRYNFDIIIHHHHHHHHIPCYLGLLLYLHTEMIKSEL